MKRPKIGVAFSGGGARGFAHIGVLKALTEANIPIDYLAGTSIGAVMAAGYAHKRDMQQLQHAALRFDFMDFVKPYDKKVLLNSKKIINYFSDFLNNASFADLAIPLSVVTTDIKAMQSYILTKGPVAIAIAASSTSPYIHEPIIYEDKLLVDGGLVSMLPADTVENMGADIIIAVDVYKSPYTFSHEKLKLSTFQKKVMTKIPVASLLWNRQISSFLKHANAITSNELKNLRLSSITKPLILIKPELDGITTLSFEKRKEAIKKGYIAGKAALEEIKAILQNSTENFFPNRLTYRRLIIDDILN